MKIYTRTGDGGETSLYTGERVKKSDARIDCLGELDELCSHIGLVKAEASADADAWSFLNALQADLFNIMSMLATRNDGKYAVTSERIEALEIEIDKLQSRSPERQGFVVPGASVRSAHIDIARSVARRAERRLNSLAALEPVDGGALIFLNRLSDYLFALSVATTPCEAK